MKKIYVPTAEEVIWTNWLVCQKGRNPHICSVPGKVESALHTAFFPGEYPFAAGGLAKVAAALCFYLVKSHAFTDGNKRTAALSAIAFLNKNEWDLRYPINEKKVLMLWQKLLKTVPLER